MKVFLDAGHGGKDPGSSGNGLIEKHIALSVALKTGEILKRHNVDVSYSRTTYTFIELSNRANRANVVNADAFVSFHTNAFSDINAQGVETYSHTGSVNGKILATNIHKSIVESKLYTKNRGVKTANFAVLKNTKMPAVLVELGFITNVEDATILRNKQNELAESIAKGILKHLGIKYQATNLNPVKEEIVISKEVVSEWAEESWGKAVDVKVNDGIGPKNNVTEEQLMVFFDRLGLLD